MNMNTADFDSLSDFQKALILWSSATFLGRCTGEEIIAELYCIDNFCVETIICAKSLRILSVERLSLDDVRFDKYYKRYYGFSLSELVKQQPSFVLN